MIIDEQYNRPYKTCFGEDAIDYWYCRRLLERNFNKPLVIEILKKL